VIVAIESHQGALHMQISTIGLDIAKNVFQVLEAPNISFILRETT
jgi:hypothetical protein